MLAAGVTYFHATPQLGLSCEYPMAMIPINDKTSNFAVVINSSDLLVNVKNQCRDTARWFALMIVIISFCHLEEQWSAC